MANGTEPESFPPDDIITKQTTEVDLSSEARQILSAEQEGKRACLVFLTGMDAGRVVPLDEGVVVLGRSTRCNAMVQEDGISRRHAKVWLDLSGQAIVQDLGSTNGTYVKGKKIRNAKIDPDEKIMLGRHTVLKFVLQDALEQSFQEGLYASSHKDALTGIFNRKGFKDRMTSDLSYARRHHIAASLILLNIDRMEAINLEYGPHTGDQVVVSMTNVIKEMIRSEDTFARLSPEDFAVLAKGIDHGGADAFAQRIGARISKQQVAARDDTDRIVDFTISAGIAAIHPYAVVDSGTVITVAQANLRVAKKRGPNHFISSLIR